MQWPHPGPTVEIQKSDSLGAGAVWTPAGQIKPVIGTEKLTIPVSPTARAVFYRAVLPP